MERRLWSAAWLLTYDSKMSEAFADGSALQCPRCGERVVFAGDASCPGCRADYRGAACQRPRPSVCGSSGLYDLLELAFFLLSVTFVASLVVVLTAVFISVLMPALAVPVFFAGAVVFLIIEGRLGISLGSSYYAERYRYFSGSAKKKWVALALLIGVLVHAGMYAPVLWFVLDLARVM